MQEVSIPATRQTSTHNLFFINLYIFTWNKQYAFQFIQPAFYQNALLWFIQALRQEFRNRDLSLQYILHGILKLGRMCRLQRSEARRVGKECVSTSRTRV